ncbi:MAG: hypothetical protein U0X86_000664 [Wolbachia endosymbiont of Xenopsylla cheopis]
MLITKNQDNNFTFFDPNDGMRFNLTQEKLLKVVNNKLEYWHQSCDFNQVVFVNNTKLLNRVRHEIDNSTSILEPEILPIASLNQSLA